MEDVVSALRSDVDSYQEVDMVVRWSAVLADSLRRMRKVNFSPNKRLNVGDTSI